MKPEELAKYLEERGIKEGADLIRSQLETIRDLRVIAIQCSKCNTYQKGFIAKFEATHLENEMLKRRIQELNERLEKMADKMRKDRINAGLLGNQN
jgi:hypothetical protein